MHIYINENTIIPYNGEILKRFVGNKLIKAISNPSEKELQEFGYMKLVDDPTPEYDETIQHIDSQYRVVDNEIHIVHTVVDNEEEIHNEDRS